MFEVEWEEVFGEEAFMVNFERSSFLIPGNDG
jgi:hypothetical protein